MNRISNGYFRHEMIRSNNRRILICWFVHKTAFYCKSLHWSTRQIVPHSTPTCQSVIVNLTAATICLRHQFDRVTASAEFNGHQSRSHFISDEKRNKFYWKSRIFCVIKIFVQEQKLSEIKWNAIARGKKHMHFFHRV